MVNIVTLPSGRYAIDVGFGSNGAVQPLALRPDIISTGIGPQEHRLLYKSIIPYTNPHQKLWVFQHRNSSEDEWSDAYAFTDLEFLPMDYEMISFWTSQSGKSWFARKIVAVRMILEGEEVVGTVILEDTEIKRRIKGKTEHLGIFTTEAERVEALKKWFDIELSEEEKGGIKGTTTQLPEI
ncbi:arylamine n-acetyltransferase 1 [Lasallia pustulata]|uniref:Tpa: arylamine n-acetyltransferase 1 n=1 Tax=Lasallia pustulata TaxID=136370 RepID=A0A1W5CYR4_9LECA|nr:arylamine n-acetyltransferase 1 [Lasallia pustulata]